ncbi:hypothetical protein BY996DRAFT_1968744 [Phakopsora pachyrhizi]|nr:hypothetical protein BY996DRAFT_1968744 [Phakopsora pachyrhizi]
MCLIILMFNWIKNIFSKLFALLLFIFFRRINNSRKNLNDCRRTACFSVESNHMIINDIENGSNQNVDEAIRSTKKIIEIKFSPIYIIPDTSSNVQKKYSEELDNSNPLQKYQEQKRLRLMDNRSSKKGKETPISSSFASLPLSRGLENSSTVLRSRRGRREFSSSSRSRIVPSRLIS